MATITERKSKKSGRVSFLAQVRVGKFKAAAKTFRVETTKAEAKVRAAEWADSLEKIIRAETSRGVGRRDITQLTIGALITEYLADPKTKSLRTYHDTERQLGWWLRKYGTNRVFDFGVMQVREARQTLDTPERSHGTTNRYLSVMRSAWNWARSAGLIAGERAWPMRQMLTEDKGRERFLKAEEVPHLLEVAEADPVVRVAIIVSLSAGMRQGELLGLSWPDVDLIRGTCVFHRTKNGERRTVHLTPVAVGALKSLKKMSAVSQIPPADQHVFLTASGTPLQQSYLESRWRRIRSKAKMEGFRWHDLRHSCASFLAREGASLLEIGSVLGHKSPAVTLRYSHLVQGAPVKGHAELDNILRRANA
jgi:integrase